MTLSKNLDNFVAALEPAARELGSLQFRWISSVPSSSAISDLEKYKLKVIHLSLEYETCACAWECFVHSSHLLLCQQPAGESEPKMI